MSTITGPDFLAFQVADLEKSATFYTEVLGLKRLPPNSPDAIVFATSPIPFAVRKPVQALGSVARGVGTIIWLGCTDLDAMHARLKAASVSNLTEPTASPFGRVIRFHDPDGYPVTLHERAVEESKK